MAALELVEEAALPYACASFRHKFGQEVLERIPTYLPPIECHAQSKTKREFNHRNHMQEHEHDTKSLCECIC